MDNNEAKVKIEELRQNGKTNRTKLIVRTITGGAVGSIAVAGWVVVEIHHPPWLKVVMIFAPALAALIAPSVWIGWIMKTYKQYTQSHYQRQLLIEKKVDPHRESSGIKHDGSGPHDHD